MKEDLRIALSLHSVPIALGAGTAAFLIMYLAMIWIARWEWLGAAVVATAAFIVGVLGMYIVTNNIVDSYTVEVATEARVLNQQLQILCQKTGQMKRADGREVLGNICTHVKDLVSRTRRSQPNKLLSVVSGLKDWLKDSVIPLLDQYIDVQNNAEYFVDATARIERGENALRSFDTFLLNSIRTLEKGENLEFDTAANMLVATRFTII